MRGCERMEPQWPPAAMAQDAGALSWRVVLRASHAEEVRAVESLLLSLLLFWRTLESSDLAWVWRSATQSASGASLQVAWS